MPWWLSRHNLTLAQSEAFTSSLKSSFCLFSGFTTLCTYHKHCFSYYTWNYSKVEIYINIYIICIHKFMNPQTLTTRDRNSVPIEELLGVFHQLIDPRLCDRKLGNSKQRKAFFPHSHRLIPLWVIDLSMNESRCQGL